MPMTAPTPQHGADFALTLSCEDTIGIVHAVTGFLFERGCNIIDSAQFGDPDTRRFFMRVAFAHGPAGAGQEQSAAGLRTAFAPIATSSPHTRRPMDDVLCAVQAS